MRPPLPLKLGDVVELKKPHPCGTNRWELVRLGADIKLKCQGCGRLVMLPRDRVERRIRKFLYRAGDDSALPDQSGGSREDATGVDGPGQISTP